MAMKKKSMRRKGTPKLHLHRETLRALEPNQLGQINGGVTERTVCGGCHTFGPTLCTRLC
jgi:hypothetical protein